MTDNKGMQSNTSILGGVYTDGYNDGWSQASQLSVDDAVEAGRLDEMHRWEGRINGIRFRWFMAGMIVIQSIWWLV